MNIFSGFHTTTKHSLSNLPMLENVLSRFRSAGVFGRFLGGKPNDHVPVDVYPTIFTALSILRSTFRIACDRTKSSNTVSTAAMPPWNGHVLATTGTIKLSIRKFPH
jgi:hypothetical protein